MPRKPRVHEIANEVQVDVKALMRALREMGEHVKGPSSSIEPPVARRLREMFRAHKPVIPAPSITVRAVPGPPGTRSQVFAPIPSSFMSAHPIFEGVQDPPPVPPRPPISVPAPMKSRQPWPASPQPTRQAPAPMGSAKQPPSIMDTPVWAPPQQRARPPQPAPIRKKPPAASVRPEIARVKRVATPPRIVLPEGDSAHDESLLARRNVVVRPDHDWDRYKIAGAERQRWISAGFKPDQAHIAAMCRIFRGRGLIISPTHAQLALSTGRTVLDEFNRGTNAVEVLVLVAEKRGLELIPDFDSRVRKILEAPTPAPASTAPTLPVDTAAPSVPRIANALATHLGAGTIDPDIELFWRECETFRQTGRAGTLVKLLAQAHGVFGDKGLTATLLDNLPAHARSTASDSGGVGLFRNAIRERRFYHVSGDAVDRVMNTSRSHRIVPAIGDLPSASGFAILQGGSSIDQTDVLVWRHSGEKLSATLLPYRRIIDGTGLEATLVESLSAGNPLHGSIPTAVKITAAIASDIRHPSEPQPLAPSHTTRESKSMKREPTSRDEQSMSSVKDEDVVVLVYASAKAANESAFVGEDHRAVSRWWVNGHYRRQPYPSSGEVRTIWIEGHEAGARDGGLVSNDRVRVLR